MQPRDRVSIQAQIDKSVARAYANLAAMRGALINRAFVVGNPAVHTPSAATITAFAGIKLVAKGSGLFDVGMSVQSIAVAGDVIAWTIDVYTDAVAGTPLTLPANAAAAGVGCFVDNSGAGIAPSAGATVAAVIAAPSHTIGTTQANDLFDWAGIFGAGGIAVIPAGQTFYATLSVTNSVAARALSQLTLSAFELPA